MTFILPGGLGQQFAVPGFSAWSATNSSGVTFSNNNRTITGTSVKANSASGTRTHNNGKWYFEITFGTVDAYASFTAGVASTSWVPGGAGGAGGDPYTGGAGAQGNWVVGGQTLGWTTGFTGPAAANGDVIGVLLNLQDYVPAPVGLWLRKGANWFNGGSPTTTFPSAAADLQSTTAGLVWQPLGSAGTSTATINVGNAAFANAPPSGYLAWG